MNNDLLLPLNADSKPFIEKFSQELDKNLSPKIIKVLSSILALDYANRLKEKLELALHVDNCLNRLEKYLGHQVITDESFSQCLTLFTTAIQDRKEKEPSQDNKEQATALALDCFIEIHFRDLPVSEKANLKVLLKTLTASKNAADLINFINSNPKLFYSLVHGSSQDKKKQAEFVEIHINRIIKESKLLAKKRNRIVNICSELSFIVSLTATLSLGISFGSKILASIILPATATITKFSPSIGGKLGKIIAKNNRNLQQQYSTLEQVKNDIVDLSVKTKTLTKILLQTHNMPLETIRDKLNQQKATTSHAEELTHSKKISIKVNKGQNIAL